MTDAPSKAPVVRRTVPCSDCLLIDRLQEPLDDWRRCSAAIAASIVRCRVAGPSDPGKAVQGERESG